MRGFIPVNVAFRVDGLIGSFVWHLDFLGSKLNGIQIRKKPDHIILADSGNDWQT